MRRQVASVLTVAVLSILQTAGADVIVLESLKDNTLYEDETGSLSNGTGSHFFAGRTEEEPAMDPNAGDFNLRRGLLAFDIAAGIPAGSTIDSVTLTLRMNRTRSGERTMTLHRVLGDWGEGASVAPERQGRGGPPAPGDATWLHTFYDPTSPQLWNTPGGDFAAAASASSPVGGNGFYTWGSTAGMEADVQTWLDAPDGNFGWILVGDETPDQPSTKRFYSRSALDPLNRPRLSVAFTVPEPSVPGLLACGAWPLIRRRACGRSRGMSAV